MSVWPNIYCGHRWSNVMLIDLLATLADEQLAVTVPGAFGDLGASMSGRPNPDLIDQD